eukprot:6441300-Amphidinium_carterae.2
MSLSAPVDYGYVTLDASMSGGPTTGPTFFRAATSADRKLIREDPDPTPWELKKVSADVAQEYEAIWNEVPIIAADDLSFLRFLIAKILPPPRLLRTLDQLLEPKVPYGKKHKSNLETATCITASSSSFVLPSGDREVIPFLYRESLGNLGYYGGASLLCPSLSLSLRSSLSSCWWSLCSSSWVGLPLCVGDVEHLAGGGKVLKTKQEPCQHQEDFSGTQNAGSSSSVGSAYEGLQLTCRSIMKLKPPTEVHFCLASPLVCISHIKALIGEVAQHFDWVLFEDNVATVQYSTLPSLAGRERRTRRRRKANDDSDLSSDELRHIFELEDMRPGDPVTVNQTPLDGEPGVLTALPGHCTDNTMDWTSFISFGDTVMGVGAPSEATDSFFSHGEHCANFLHDGGASVPDIWPAIYSESDDQSDDFHLQQHESDSGLLDSDMNPSVGVPGSLSSPSTISSDMGDNPDSLGTSRVVSLSYSMASDLDGSLGYVYGEDGVLRPHGLEVELPPLLVLPPQVLTPCPPILSNLPCEVQDSTGDLQSSLSSSLVVSLPCSPRSDLGGVIGYAVDNMGGWHPFDLELPEHGELLPPPLAVFHRAPYLLEGGHLATVLPVQCLFTGGMITIKVDHGMLSFVDSIDPRLPLADWKKANDLSTRDLIWQGARLDPAICLERRSATSLTVTLIPRMWHEGEQPVIRPFQQCSASTVWSC